MPDIDRAQLLRLVLPLLGPRPTFPVRVRVRDAVGEEAELVFGRNDLAGGPREATPATPQVYTSGNIPDEERESPAGGLLRVHRKLIEKAGPAPIPTKKLIAAAGYNANSYNRAAVTFLCREGYLERTPDGIRLGRRKLAS